MAIVKPGGPIDPASGPARVRRNPEDADDTRSRTGAAVGSGIGSAAHMTGEAGSAVKHGVADVAHTVGHTGSGAARPDDLVSPAHRALWGGG